MLTKLSCNNPSVINNRYLRIINEDELFEDGAINPDNFYVVEFSSQETLIVEHPVERVMDEDIVYDEKFSFPTEREASEFVVNRVRELEAQGFRTALNKLEEDYKMDVSIDSFKPAWVEHRTYINGKDLKLVRIRESSDSRWFVVDEGFRSFDNGEDFVFTKDVPFHTIGEARAEFRNYDTRLRKQGYRMEGEVEPVSVNSLTWEFKNKEGDTAIVSQDLNFTEVAESLNRQFGLTKITANGVRNLISGKNKTHQKVSLNAK